MEGFYIQMEFVFRNLLGSKLGEGGLCRHFFHVEMIILGRFESRGLIFFKCIHGMRKSALSFLCVSTNFVASSSYQLDAKFLAEGLLWSQETHCKEHEVRFVRLLRAGKFFHCPATSRILE